MRRISVKVSKNFDSEEFACKCGCGKNNIGAAVVFILQRVRDHYDVPVTVTSACRCLVYNRSEDVGSNDNSQHPRRTAVDFTVEGVHPLIVSAQLCTWYPTSLGIGTYNNFTHVDTRKVMARW